MIVQSIHVEQPLALSLTFSLWPDILSSNLLIISLLSLLIALYCIRYFFEYLIY